MTVIAWKDGFIAADRCSSVGSLKVESKKLVRFGNVVLATCGPADFGASLINWYRDGAKPEAYPKHQERDDWGTLVVAKAPGVYIYYQVPVWVERLGPFSAVGDGAEMAMGAMAAGASAAEAVKICIAYISTCGFGVDVDRYKD